MLGQPTCTQAKACETTQEDQFSRVNSAQASTLPDRVTGGKEHFQNHRDGSIIHDFMSIH